MKHTVAKREAGGKINFLGVVVPVAYEQLLSIVCVHGLSWIRESWHR